MLNRHEYRHLLLAGTVTFPATFPQVGRLELRTESLPVLCGTPAEILTITETPSSRVTLARQVLAASVRAVFLPRDLRQVNYSDGKWLLASEVSAGLKHHLQECTSGLFGIVFMAEHEPSLLNVTAGMTAAESVQYYPPLPGDPSHNHYNPHVGAIPPGGQFCSLGHESASCNLSEPPPPPCQSMLLESCNLVADPPFPMFAAAPFVQFQSCN